MMLSRISHIALVLSLPLGTLAAQNPAPAADPAAAFDKSEVMVPMRDGVKLHTLIYAPKGRTENLPIILTRTPYGIAGAGGAFGTSYAELAQEGFIFAFQDIRGRFTSEGQFVMLRPPRDKKDPKSIDEASDTYDTIEWMLKNVPKNNGRVGMLGVSYPGWLTVMAMLDPHPALKAVSPQASPSSMFLGDDFHHNGAFRLAYGFEYVALMESGKEMTPFNYDQYDTYNWYLTLGSLKSITDSLPQGKYPTWKNYAAHPNFDPFWQRENVVKYIDGVKVPTLNVAGWWDQEDFYGPVTIYRALEPFDKNHLNYLVVGPWNHGGWRGRTGDKLGPIEFGSNTAQYYRKNIELPWFNYWLKDKGKLELAEATTFESGSNQWKSYDSWPPRNDVTARKLYFNAGGKLSFDPPKVTKPDSAFDAYVSDPAKPVPYRVRPIPATFGQGSTWSTWLVDDQRFVSDRPDVSVWQTAPLDDDVVIAGDVLAKLYVSTTGSDADFVVKLIDVYPDKYDANPKLGGYQLMVSNDVFRSRFRKSFEKPEPLTPNKAEEIAVDLHTQSYRFKKGHRIMVQVQSSWFPLIDRNPQTFVPNIFEAKPSDFRAATQKIFRSPTQASFISLPVVQSKVVQ
jgi:hypothetical protein